MLSFYLSMLDTPEERATFADLYERTRYDCLHVALRVTGANHAMAVDAVHTDDLVVK